MPWPSDIDFVNAMQNPGTAFDDVELKTGNVELNQLGLPKPRAGNFAIVFRVEAHGRSWAVRCFKHESPDRRERYAAVTRHLTQISSPHLSQVVFQERGVRIAGTWYPILKMEWLKGELLRQWVERHLQNALALRQLAARFVQAAASLRTNGIGHGDLQHGNIVIVADQLRFIDYDSMFVPALVGRGCPELGHENFQHPGRTAHHFGPFMDDFSTWVIYVSLVALSFDPGLWQKYAVGQESLLFRRADFSKPQSSPLFAELERANDVRLRVLARSLRSLLQRSPDSLPALGDGQVLPANAIVLPCPSCRQQLRIPLDAGATAIRCQGCRHDQEWFANPGPSATVSTTASGEWWRAGLAPAPASQATGSVIDAGPNLPRVVVEAALWKPSEAFDASWILQSLQVAEKSKQSISEQSVWLERAVLVCALAASGGVGYAVFLLAMIPSVVVGGCIAVIALMAANVVLWAYRFRRSDACRAVVAYEAKRAELDAQQEECEARRREIGAKQSAKQQELEARAKAIDVRRHALRESWDAELLRVCAPMQGELARANAWVSAVSVNMANELDRVVRPIEQQTGFAQQELANAPMALQRALQDIDKQEQSEASVHQARVAAAIADLRQQAASANADEANELARAYEEFVRRVVDEELQCHDIEEASIPGIGPVLCERLNAAGIFSAREISLHALRGIEGFGDGRVATLVGWRDRIARNARVRILRLPEVDSRKIRERWQTKRATLSEGIAAMERQALEQTAQRRTRLQQQKDAERASAATREHALRQRIAMLQADRSAKDLEIRGRYSVQLAAAIAQRDEGNTLLKRAQEQVSARFAGAEDQMRLERAKLDVEATASGKALEEELNEIRAREAAMMWTRARTDVEGDSLARITLWRYAARICGIRR